MPASSEMGLYSTEYQILGVSHKTLGVEGREAFARLDADAAGLLRTFVMDFGLTEAAIISTCNRFEVVSASESAMSPECLVEVLEARLGSTLKSDSFYRLSNSQAIKHLFRVVSSVDSMVVGEAQILGQVKDSYHKAVASGSVGRRLHHLFQFAFSVAKKVRANTGIAERGVSVSYVAVKLAKQIFGGLENRTVLVVGSGRMAELAALHLRSYGVKDIIVANRTIERALELAGRIGGSAISLEEIPLALARVDVAIGSIGNIDRPIIDIASIERSRRTRPLFLIDLGVPRNFSAALGGLDDVYLYNIDDLSLIADENEYLREEAAKDAEIIIDYGLFQFERWLVKVSAEPAILNFRSHVLGVCESEVRKSLENLLKPEVLNQVIPGLSHKIAQKVSHEITKVMQRMPGGKLDPDSLVPLLFDEFFSFL